MNQFIQKNFTLFIITSMILGFFFDSFFMFFGEITLQLLACLMISSFLGMNYRLFFERIKKPGTYVLVFFSLKVVLAALLYYAVRPFNELLAAGVLFITAAPAAGVSPSLTRICRGDVEFIIGLLILTTILSPFTLPVTMNLLAGADMDIDVMGMVRTMVMIIIIPMAVSVTARKFFGKTIEKTQPYLSSAAVIIISLMLLGLCAKGADVFKANLNLLLLFGGSAVLLGILLTLGGYFIFPFLDHRKRTGLSLSTLYINVGLIVVLASRYFPEEVMLFTLCYMIPANVLPGIIRRFVIKANIEEEKAAGPS